MAITEAQVLSVLSQVKDPELGRDVVSLDMIKDLTIKDDAVDLKLVLTTPACPVREEFQQSVHDAVAGIAGVTKVNLTLDAQVSGVTGGGKIAPNVRNIIAVGSGKGGVGKSTVAVNLAISLHRMGASVGILDADIYGPNVPRMMGVKDMPQPQGNTSIPVIENYGIKIMSMGFFIPDGQAVVWRGPMIHGAIQQMLKDVDWGELDYLIIDLPPGTGDASLSLAQLVPLTGAVIVLTPSEVALEDGVKAISMFRKLEVPILGLIENMSYFACPHCDEPVDIFGRGASKRVCQQYSIEFLGEIPIDPMVRIGGDDGIPASIGAPESATAKQFAEVARGLAGKISIQNLNRSEALPTIQMHPAPR